MLAMDILSEIESAPGGEKLKDCIQCGTCSGSCPVVEYIDYTPRRLFAMAKAGMVDEVLSAESIWICCSCYLCTVRCPRGIEITDIMYVIKNIAQRERRAKGDAPFLIEQFSNIIKRFGRNREFHLLSSFFLRHPEKAFYQLRFAKKMAFQKRLILYERPISGMEELKAMIEGA
jgi:heterodisulfide reductase subunit C